MLNPDAKLNPDILQDLAFKKMSAAAQDIQDEIFKKMPVEKKLSLLDDFFRFGKELQNLNDRIRR